MDSRHEAATPPLPAVTAASPPIAPPQPSPPSPHLFPPWRGSIQAMYGAGAASSAGAQPYYPGSFLWRIAGGDPNPPHPYMLTPYGLPMAYPPPVFPPDAAYAHLSTGSVYIAAEAEAERKMIEACRSMKGGSVTLKPPPHKVASDSLDENASHSNCESAGSYEAKEESTCPQRKNCSGTFGEGGSTHHLASTQHSSSTESSPDVNHPVFELERTVLRNPVIDLNVEMGSTNAFRMNLKDGRELRREKRKQSNRDSARRSRLRKQQECEYLATRVDELNEETCALRNKLDRINKDCEELETENNSMEEELVCWFGPGVLSTVEGRSSLEASRLIKKLLGRSRRTRYIGVCRFEVEDRSGIE